MLGSLFILKYYTQGYWDIKLFVTLYTNKKHILLHPVEKVQ